MMNVHRLQLVSGNTVSGADGEISESASARCNEIRAELKRLMQSSQFDASARNRRFLEYVVEETLAGRAHRIKAYNIATDVFGRDESFNPQLDPVVRMEARRLRRSLERFYLVDRVRSIVHIEMPKGSYVASFEFGHASHPATSKSAESVLLETSTQRGTSIFISPFAVEGNLQCTASYSDGLLRQIAVGINRLGEISVFTSVPLPSGSPGSSSYHPSPVTGAIDLILTGDTSFACGKLNATTALVDAQCGRVIWGETFIQSCEVNGILEARDRLAERIVLSLAEQCCTKARARPFDTISEIDG